MADVLSTIPAAVLRNLSDKLYEKRKNAALEVHILHMNLLMYIWDFFGVEFLSEEFLLWANLFIVMFILFVGFAGSRWKG